MGRLHQVIRNIDNLFEITANLISVSVLWCICSLGIVTVIPASHALYKTVEQTVKYQNAYPVKTFFAVLRRNMKRKLFAGFCFILAGVFILIVISCADFMYATGRGSGFFPVFCRIAAAYYIIFWISAAPVLGDSLSVKQLLAEGWICSVRYFITNLMVLCALACGAWIAVAMPVCLLVIPGVVGLISVWLMSGRSGGINPPAPSRSHRNS